MEFNVLNVCLDSNMYSDRRTKNKGKRLYSLVRSLSEIRERDSLRRIRLYAILNLLM